MNYKTFFNEAKLKGITESELTISGSYNISIELFESQVSKYNISESKLFSARGIIDGKLGFANTEEDGKSGITFLANQIVNNSKLIEKDSNPFIFKGSKKYKKKNLYSTKLDEYPMEKKVARLYEIEQKIKEYDKRIFQIEGVEYSESRDTFAMYNSHGLKLKQGSNCYVYVASIAVRGENDEVKTGFKLFFDNDPEKFDVDKFVKELCDDALNKLGGTPCKSGKYKCVLSGKVTASLMHPYVASSSSEEVQKKSSMFIGMLNKEVASKKVTILEKPLSNNIFYTYFDDEGVAKTNKTIIDKGILKTYLYNLETASKDGVETTGNASNRGNKIGVSFTNLYLKPGKKSEEELFAKIGNGLYITGVSGLHAGLNAQSGNFSLEAEGFLIKDGKLDKPVSLITVAGNLMTLFKDIKEVANNSELLSSGTTTASVYVKSLAISGK